MKKSFLLTILVIVTGMSYYGCKESMVDDAQNKSAKSRARIAACTPVVLSGTYTTPQHLTSTNTYLLRGSVVIDGTTLTIDDGVTIFGEKATQGALIIQPDAQIDAQGTVTSPIVFTSDQAASSRAPGDWVGVVLQGEAPNNQSNALSILIGGSAYTAGGTNNSHDAGTMSYVQIHFGGAGGGAGSDGKSESAFILNSVGSGTDISHIQISNSLKDGVGIWGGTVKLDHIFNLDVQRTDFRLSYGYVGRDQFWGAIRKNAAPASAAYGMEITNVLLSESTAASPQTYPTLSNLSLLGPSYCGGSPDNDFLDGIAIQKNGSAKIYNSVVSSQRRYGLFLDGNAVVQNTSSGNELQFSYNSFHNIGSPYFNFTASTSWSAASGCESSMTLWFNGGSLPCKESGNQTTVTTLGYNASFCEDYCDEFEPDFTLNTVTTTLSAPVFTWDSGNLFDHPTYRGAFGSTGWVTNDWADLCPQNTQYCL